MNEFEKLVSEMRTAQICFFKTKDRYYLGLSKTLEKKVDSKLSEINNPKLEL
tara:strand:+ start:36742 stop:36897 length:156 start_codon:yes stop_codon:yes gene_type:complete